MSHVLALDQGTTSTRAVVFDAAMRPVASAQVEFPQKFPQSGWVEHDPEDLWQTSLETMRAAIAKASLSARDLAGLGITNQRETTVVWNRATGRPIRNAIVWQDRRTAEICQSLRERGHEPLVTARTGLLLDPYFSATKIAWILDNVAGARAQAERGELAFGTVDCFLLWRLTKGRVHATDASNAARTALCDIRSGTWDPALLDVFRVPPAMLPEIRDSAAEFGMTDPEWFGHPIPIRGIAGDQQAATLGQGCVMPGMMKSTYGTGCFALLNTGEAPVVSRARLLSTIAWQLSGVRTYALEGAIFVAGAAVQWLRDGLRIIDAASETEAMAEAADPAQRVMLVPAFTGLGAPWWDAEARGALYGLTRATGRHELARAALESVGFQTRDLIEAMRRDWSHEAGSVLRVDGGMTVNAWAMQFLADILGNPVDRPAVTETTALGAAYLAALQAGLAPEPGAWAERWQAERRFTPRMPASIRDVLYAAWQDAVGRTLQQRPRHGQQVT
jgi:glycerol kinase